VSNRQAFTGVVFVLKTGILVAVLADRDGLWQWQYLLASIFRDGPNWPFGRDCTRYCFRNLAELAPSTSSAP
jgi:hypothetical protein